MKKRLITAMLAAGLLATAAVPAYADASMGMSGQSQETAGAVGTEMLQESGQEEMLQQGAEFLQIAIADDMGDDLEGSAEEVLAYSLDSTRSAAAGDSGTCGENLTWTLDAEGTLTISGEGEMDFRYCGWSNPWRGNDFIHKVIIEEGAADVDGSAFAGCTNLSEVVLPDSVTFIGNYAFSECINLSEITLPNGMTDIKEGTFSSCTGLEKIVIPDAMTSISYNAFQGCSNLSEITLPETINYIGRDAFLGTAYADNAEHWKNGILYLDGWILDSSNDLPADVVIGEDVKGIAAEAFRGREGLRSITIPDSVAKIGDYAFAQCPALVSVTLPDSITEIAYGMFRSCSSLASVSIPGSVKAIGEKTFRGCSSLVSIALPEGMIQIAGNTFEDCSSLASVSIPDSVESIEGAAFSGCRNLVSVNIPDSVKSIEGGAFFGCSSLVSVNIPDSVQAVGGNAFWGTAYAENPDHWNNGILYLDGWALGVNGELPRDVVIPEGVKGIANSTFRFCTKLQAVTIPNGVEYIGYDTFAYCSNLANIELPGSLREIGYHAFFNCRSLTNIELPGSLREIGYGAFFDCSSLAAIDLPKGIKEIGDSAFGGCLSLKQVTIPKNTISVGHIAFGYHDAIGWPIDGFTISGYANSAGQRYAAENNFPFTLLEAEQNMEGTISIKGGSTDDVSIQIKAGDELVAIADMADQIYSIYELPDGTYTMEISKPNYATRIYSFTIINGTAESIDAEIHLVGDIDGDGKANMRDLNRVCDHIRRKAALTDYDFACADITGDGEAVNTRDLNRICDHIRGKKLLWD